MLSRATCFKVTARKKNMPSLKITGMQTVTVQHTNMHTLTHTNKYMNKHMNKQTISMTKAAG